MGYGHKLQFTTTSTSGLQSISGYDTEAVNTNGEISGNLSIAANSVNAAVSPFSFNGAKIQDIFILSSQNATLYINNSASNSIALIAGIPFVWGTSMPASAPYPTNPYAGVNSVVNAAITCNAATGLKYLLGSS